MKGPIHQGIASLSPYRPGKSIDELTRELGITDITDITELASNRNPRGPGPLVLEALRSAAVELSRYPDGSGRRLKQALSEHLGVSAAQITLGNGSNDVLDLAVRMTMTAGAEAIVSAHAFVVFRLVVASCGGKLIEVPALDYGANLPGFLDAITADTAIVFLANPNNPTGTWVTRDALEEFLEAVPERVWVVLDEAYAEYVELPDYPDGLALQRRYPNLIVTRTFSKIHALAALRIGYAVSSVEVADLLNRARQPFNVNALALAAAEAATADQEFVMTSRMMNRDVKAVLIAGLSELGLDYIPSAGNFVCVDCGGRAVDRYQALLRRGVIVLSVADYGLPNHLRVSVGLPEENARFLSALAEVLAEERG
jgi:histidinol-phosphate aminotransferase